MSQSKFKLNQDIQLNTNIQVTPRLLRKLENGWSGHFNHEVVPILIEGEDMFAPLYSSKSNSRPSTPTYFVLGALVLKDLFGLTDEEIEDRIAFSLDFQYTLGLFPLTISRSIREYSIASVQRITCIPEKLALI